MIVSTTFRNLILPNLLYIMNKCLNSLIIQHRIFKLNGSDSDRIVIGYLYLFVVDASTIILLFETTQLMLLLNKTNWQEADFH